MVKEGNRHVKHRQMWVLTKSLTNFGMRVEEVSMLVVPVCDKISGLYLTGSPCELRAWSRERTDQNPRCDERGDVLRGVQ